MWTVSEEREEMTVLICMTALCCMLCLVVSFTVNSEGYGEGIFVQTGFVLHWDSQLKTEGI